MRNDLDFAPLYRSSIGFDRVFSLLNNAQRLQAIDRACRKFSWLTAC